MFTLLLISFFISASALPLQLNKRHWCCYTVSSPAVLILFFLLVHSPFDLTPSTLFSYQQQRDTLSGLCQGAMLSTPGIVTLRECTPLKSIT